MSISFTTQAARRAAPPQRPSFWLGLVAAVAGIAALALAGVPLLLGALAAPLGATAPHAYWYISRACAFVAFGLLWLSMLAGLGITSRLAQRWPSLPGSFELHRFTALLGLGFALMHALVLMGDQYIQYTLAQVLVPFLSSNYQPVWVGFGQLAFYLLAVVACSFYVKDRLGIHAWRLIHLLSFALFLMTIIHGLESGTDSPNLWAQGLYAAAGASVLGLSVYRVLTVRRGRARTAAAGTGLVAAGGRAAGRTAGAQVLLAGRPVSPARPDRPTDRHTAAHPDFFINASRENGR